MGRINVRPGVYLALVAGLVSAMLIGACTDESTAYDNWAASTAVAERH